MNNYSFIVDGGLHVSARAATESVARKRIEQSYPRATITLKGVNLESAERGLAKPMQSMNTASKAKTQRFTEAPVKRRPTERKKGKFDGLDLNETERSLVQGFV